MSSISRAIVGLFALLLLLGGFLMILSAFGDETLEGFLPIVTAVLGTGLVNAALLMYNNIGNERIKNLLEENNELLEELVEAQKASNQKPESILSR